MTATRTRRTTEQRIADLQAQVEKLKAQAAAKKLKKDPSLRHISAAVRSLDKATAATGDKTTRTALTEVRATLAACLALNGAVPTAGGTRKRAAKSSGPAPDEGKVLAYIRKHPRSRSEDICAELGTDTAVLRPVLHKLRDAGKVKVEGKARATTYSAA
jgi:hypothetical protein